MYTCIQACVHTHACTCIRVHTHARARAHKYAVRTHVHTRHGSSDGSTVCVCVRVLVAGETVGGAECVVTDREGRRPRALGIDGSDGGRRFLCTPGCWALAADLAAKRNAAVARSVNHVRTSMCACLRVCVRASVPAYVQACMHACVGSYVGVCACVGERVVYFCALACQHLCAYLYTYMYAIHTFGPTLLLFPPTGERHLCARWPAAGPI